MSNWVRQLPLVVGILGGSLLLSNRLLFTPELVTSQSRSDALGILLSILLILTGILGQERQPPDPSSVVLEGTNGFELDPGLTEAQKIELGWASRSVLAATAARVVVVWWQGKVLLRRGILPEERVIEPGGILNRVLSTGQSVYLVDLKLFPARSEFTHFLPANTQSVLCQPIGQQGVLILGTEAPRSLTQRDQVWIEAMAQKLDSMLSEEEA